jgi:hypothetical protein
MRITEAEFLQLVEDWAAWWQRRHAEGEEGFEGGPRHLQDWLGSVDAFARITTLMGNAEVGEEPPARTTRLQ